MGKSPIGEIHDVESSALWRWFSLVPRQEGPEDEAKSRSACGYDIKTCKLSSGTVQWRRSHEARRTSHVEGYTREM